MPELPDVEGFKRMLTRNALRKTIDRVVVSDARILGELSVQAFASRLEGAKLIEARRHGKHLMAKLDSGCWLTLHFGMTGALQFVRTPDSEPSFTRVRFDLANDGSLAYTNKRMIGRVGWVEDAADFIAAEKLGHIQKANGKLRPLGISTLWDRVCMTAAMLVLEPIFEADLPLELYAYRPGREWHEPDEARVSPSGSVRGSG